MQAIYYPQSEIKADFYKVNFDSNFKGSVFVNVISSDLPFKDGNARFTMVPLKPFSDH